jgi:lactate dehydrogenase-like 2-hydroxyacid dehydrogenase
LPAKLARFGEVTDDMNRLGEAHVALIRSKTKATREWLDQAPNLKLIIRGGVGTDNIDKEAAKERGIRVHNTPKASGIAVAELAFAMMIAVPNHLVRAHNSMARASGSRRTSSAPSCTARSWAPSASATSPASWPCARPPSAWTSSSTTRTWTAARATTSATAWPTSSASATTSRCTCR